jgi:hypothetical protein
MKISISNSIILASVVFLGILSFSRCAKVVSPSGGPKDTIPPHTVEETPPNYSKGFSEDEIEIEFNEFISLKKIDDQFISSPPFEEEPDIMERGKELKIVLNDTLRDSTTYTLNFGNAIVDFRESNPLKNFRYVFSTGSTIDSMYVEGQVFDALTLTPKENVVVMLYDRFKDSLPMQQVPLYVARTDKKGRFLLPNLRKDKYKIFSLADINRNYLYDSPQEDIAFSDSTITFTEKEFTKTDTLYKDTIELEERDSLVIDTIIKKQIKRLAASEYKLRMFNEDKGKQYLKSYSRKRPQKISFTFNRPVEKDSITLNLIDSIDHKDFLLPEKYIKDTLSYWILDSSIYNQQYLQFEISYLTTDSVGESFRKHDTVDLSYSFKKKISDTAKLKTNISATENFDLDEKIHVSLPYPIKSIDTSGICLWEKKDTVLLERKPIVKRDTGNLFGFSLTNDLKQDTKYKLQIIPYTVNSIYDFYHDTLDVEFRTQKRDHYGQLTMNLDTINEPFIFQFLKNEGKVYREEWYPASYSKKLSLDYIDPGEYSLRIILDSNSNKKWDPGDYLKHIQPERVAFYPRKIEIRSNWELELEWNVDFNTFVKPKTEE